MSTYVYPTSVELREIEQDKLPRLINDDPAFDLFPIEEVDHHLLEWEQFDNFKGLQQVRGLDGKPGRVKQTALNQYQMAPGEYGEFEEITETELTIARQPGTFGDPIDMSRLVYLRQDKLLQRRLDLMRNIIWTLLTTGTFSVASPLGGTVHTDTYSVQTFTASPAWGTVATATPFADFRSVQLKARGHSVAFDQGAKAFMNRTTLNQLLSNTNTNDLAGRRTSGLATIDNVGQVNQLLAGDGLPQIVPFDEGYYDDSGTFQLFIPNNKVVVVGRRPSGVLIGEYRLTRNANNPNSAPGAYTRVIDRGETQIPRKLEVHDGHNGGPVIFFPSAVVVMTV